MIVITGAKGALGRAVAEALLGHRPAASIRLASGTSEKLGDLAGRGFGIAQADYKDPASLEAAFAGAEALLLVSSDATNEVRVRQHLESIRAARRAGVGRVAYVSFTNPSPKSRYLCARSYAANEVALEASGLPWTVLRIGQYAASLAPPIAFARERGVFAFPGLAGRVAYVSHADLAAAIAQVLTGAGHEGRRYELTGPEAVDGFAIAEILSRALGRPIEAVEAPPGAVAAHYRKLGLPDFVIEATLSLRAAAAAGEYEAVSPDIERLTGRPPASVRDYVAAVARG